jgi:hypothetical protein
MPPTVLDINLPKLSVNYSVLILGTATRTSKMDPNSLICSEPHNASTLLTTSFHVSFDANKLYPSVYVPEGLEILKSKLQYDRKLHERTDLSRKELLTLTELCVSEPYFECEHGTFIQEEGAPMGGPLSDLLADLIIETKIEKRISEHPKWGPLVDWIRKADDTFMEWKSTIEELHQFHQFLNSLHPKIQWSMEVAKNNRTPFLDVLVIKLGQTIETTVYRKPAASNRYIHYTSAHPWKDKIAAMKTLAARAYTYCSPKFLADELNFLTEIFLQNGYPLTVIKKHIDKRPAPLASDSESTNQETGNEFLVPFHPSAHRLTRILKNNFKIKTVNTSTNSLGSHLLKRRPPLNPLNKPGVVYAIPCECELLYIGETKRTAAIRTAEEKAACQKVDKTNKLSNNEYADLGITQHHKETGHTFQFNATKILAFESKLAKKKAFRGSLH